MIIIIFDDGAVRFHGPGNPDVPFAFDISKHLIRFKLIAGLKIIYYLNQLKPSPPGL